MIRSKGHGQSAGKIERQAGFGISGVNGSLIGRRHGFRQASLEAWIVGQIVGNVAALIADGHFPRWPAIGRLVLPFEQMRQQNPQPADQFALFVALPAGIGGG